MLLLFYFPKHANRVKKNVFFLLYCHIIILYSKISIDGYKIYAEKLISFLLYQKEVIAIIFKGMDYEITMSNESQKPQVSLIQ